MKTMSDISGQLLIAGVSVTGVGAALRGVNPATAEKLQPEFRESSVAQEHSNMKFCGVLLFVFVGLSACARGERTQTDASSNSEGALPTSVDTIPVHARRDLKESSSLTMSVSQPDIVFTINDSGNEPILYALDTAGTYRGAWRLAGATDRDWEASTRGQCMRTATGATVPPSASCIFIGEVGDNQAVHETSAIYQVEEPTVTRDTAEKTVPAEKLMFRYPDRAHDVESMYMGTDGTIFLLTKRALLSSSGTLRPSLVFALPPSSWEAKDTVTATLVDSLPIVPGSAWLREVTDASLSTDSKYLAVRTYVQIFIFATDSATGRVRHDVAPALCNIGSVEHTHGEGISWFGTTRQLLLGSERHNQPLHRVTCALPGR